MLWGFGLAGYRSFYTQQRLGPLAKINLVIGRNNSGKSNLLRYAVQHLAKAHKLRVGGQEFPAFRDLDFPKEISGLGHRPGFSVALPPPGSNDFKQWSQFLSGQVREDCDHFLSSLVGKTGGWLDYGPSDPTGRVEVVRGQVQLLVSELPSVGHISWNKLIQMLVHSKFNDLQKDVGQCLQKIAGLLPELPPVVLVPAMREIKKSSGSEPSGLDGAGLIDTLSRFKAPGHNEQELKRKFESICELLREITGDSQASLEIQHDKETINVTLDGRLLPLDAVGTGVHEAIIIAAAAAVHPDSLICLEEPEIHLHPVLQRKLLRHLATRTSNQYLIATHSAHLMDYPGAAIFHVALDENNQSVIRPVRTPADKSSVFVDLGYRPTDLLQANCVIWVEGPSDRTYLRYWFDAFLKLDPANEPLVEGIHYSIMFYGGRLLSHLSPDDPEIADFISLRRLNRFVAIVIDSDRDKKGAKLNETKQRIQKRIEEGEATQGPGLVWITKGREIENYISSSAIEEAALKSRSVPIKLKPRSDEQYDKVRIVGSRKKDGVEDLEDVDKVKVARFVAANHEPDFDVLDLRKQIQGLVQFIKRANHDR